MMRSLFSLVWDFLGPAQPDMDDRYEDKFKKRIAPQRVKIGPA